MDEAEFALRMLAAKLAVSFHRRSTVRADLDDRDAFEDAVLVFAVRFKRLDHEPLIVTTACQTLTADSDTNEFLDGGGYTQMFEPHSDEELRGKKSSAVGRATQVCGIGSIEMVEAAGVEREELSPLVLGDPASAGVCMNEKDPAELSRTDLIARLATAIAEALLEDEDVGRARALAIEVRAVMSERVGSSESRSGCSKS